MGATIPARAGNGNMLHGFGPVNSSMGGAGAGLWMDDPIGALMFNPALMTSGEGNHVSFSTEFFYDDVNIKTTLANGRTGVASPSNQLGILPAIGFTRHAPDSKWAFGFGLIGIAGFRTDYPQDTTSILFDVPQNGGFGRIYTDHRVTKIPLALAYQVTEKLALGISLNGYIGELAIAPLPYEVKDGQFYPQGDGLSNSYAVSVQPSFLYTATPNITIGGSLTTEQDYAPFKWNSTYSDPTDLSTFGKARKLEFDLDGPLSATLGVGVKVNDKLKVAFDVMWIQYDGVAGFGSPGGIVNGVVQPFGWDNVWVYKIGCEYQATNKLALRAGYNYSDIPIPDRNTLTATGAPAYFQHHFSVGVGYKLTETLTANLGFYYVPTAGATGPLLSTNGTIQTSNSLKSVQVGLSFKF